MTDKSPEPGMSILNDTTLPLIGIPGLKKDVSRVTDAVKRQDPAPILNKEGTEKFARAPKENEILSLDTDVTNQMRVIIPPIYYWEDVVDGKSILMTMAFKWRNQNWGISFPIDTENFVTISMQRKKLFLQIKQTLDVLIHHGEKVVDRNGNIDPAAVNEQEAIRFKYDKRWGQKVAAFNHLVRVAPITKKKALAMKFVEEDSIVT